MNKDGKDIDPYWYYALCTDVYDGDSITLDISLGLGVYLHNQKIRLLNIDAPEIRGEERPLGLQARDRLRLLILDRKVLVRTKLDRTGKYGRLLGTIYVDGVNINQLLLDEGLAEEYLP
jgi:micrococcal nuclease